MIIAQREIFLAQREKMIDSCSEHRRRQLYSRGSSGCPKFCPGPALNSANTKSCPIFNIRILEKSDEDSSIMYLVELKKPKDGKVIVYYYLLLLHHFAPLCTTLHHFAPLCTICTTLHHFAPLCTTLHHFAPLCTTLHHLHHFAPLCTTLHHFAPFCTTLHHLHPFAPLCTILRQMVPPPRSGVLVAAVLVRGGGGWASGFEGVPLMTRKKRHIYFLIYYINY